MTQIAKFTPSDLVSNLGGTLGNLRKTHFFKNSIIYFHLIFYFH